ncbi:MAG: 4'-phosphopantetheinyl transferase [Geobacteraceae bacterium GWC2_58_44]|nr:MAG: 4'-phosphopantetheinyl transferase [Geobacteraceae bacterium GWC2_58_44]
MVSIPAPEAGRLQLRLVSLTRMASETARLKESLTVEELRRGNRLLDKERRDRFFAGRGILRQALAGYLGEEPGNVRLSEGEFGKLHLSDHLETDSISFNLSHAGEFLLLAFAAGCEVGVDLEQVRQDLPFRAMAERYFSAREQEELFSLPPGEQICAFYRCWTRKEAYLKGTGTGFSQPSNGFDMALLPDHPAELLAHRGSPGEIGRWSIKDVAVPKGYCAAVAVEGAEPEIFLATEPPSP